MVRSTFTVSNCWPRSHSTSFSCGNCDHSPSSLSGRRFGPPVSMTKTVLSSHSSTKPMAVAASLVQEVKPDQLKRLSLLSFSTLYCEITSSGSFIAR